MELTHEQLDTSKKATHYAIISMDETKVFGTLLNSTDADKWCEAEGIELDVDCQVVTRDDCIDMLNRPDIKASSELTEFWHRLADRLFTPPVVTEPEILFTLHLPIEVTNEFVADVLSTALEGGINYWAKEITRQATERGKVEGEDLYGALVGYEYVIIPLDYDGEVKPLNLQTFREGLERYFKITTTAHTLYPLDAGEFDANCADLVVQFAVLGDIVFG